MTDALIQFNYSGGERLCSMYKRSDAFSMVNDIKRFLKKVDRQEEFSDYRLNWPQVVARLISDFVVDAGSNTNISMWNAGVDEGNHNIIYLAVVEPDFNKYDKPKKSFKTLAECIKIKIRYAHGKDVIYDGFISDFKKHTL